MKVHVSRLGCLHEQILLTGLWFPTPEWSKNSSVDRDRNIGHSKAYERSALSLFMLSCWGTIDEIPVNNIFSDWCLDYESRKCENWKDEGLCQSSIRSRVQVMIRRLCMETCNYCGKFLPSSVSNSSLDIWSKLVYYYLYFFSFHSFLIEKINKTLKTVFNDIFKSLPGDQ